MLELLTALMGAGGGSTAMGSAANGGWTTTTTPDAGMPFSMGGGGGQGGKPSEAMQGMAAAQKANGMDDDIPGMKPKPVNLGMLSGMFGQQNNRLGT